MINYNTIISAQETLVRYWGENGKKVIEIAAKNAPANMNTEEFLSRCTPCKGNMASMLLNGIHETYPEVWEAIPDDMGANPWRCIVATLVLCGIDTGK